jgi:hypothetical protein
VVLIARVRLLRYRPGQRIRPISPPISQRWKNLPTELQAEAASEPQTTHTRVPLGRVRAAAERVVGRASGKTKAYFRTEASAPSGGTAPALCAGARDDLAVLEGQITIGKRDRDPRKYSPNPSASCFSSRVGRSSFRLC